MSMPALAADGCASAASLSSTHEIAERESHFGGLTSLNAPAARAAESVQDAAAPLTRRSIGPVTFEVVDRRQAVAQVLAALQARSHRIFAFCNMHTFNMARQLPALRNALANATVFNDGLAVDVASKVLFGQPFPENLNGTDLTPALFAALDRPVKVFIVGSPPGVAEIAGRMLAERHPNVTVVGCQHGFFAPSESGEIVQRIRAEGTEILLLGMGNPRQEIWAHEIAESSGAVVLCVGAFLDFASGRIKRAPRLVRMLRAEWMFRLLREPRRLAGRYLVGAPKFLFAVYAEKLTRPR